MSGRLPRLIEIQAERARRNLHYFVQRFAWPALQPATPFQDNWHIGAICEHLEAVATGQIKRLLINMPFRMLKPVRVDSMIIERTKGRIPIEQIAVGDEVLTHRGRFRKVLATRRHGELETLRISTHSGRSAVAAPDHPFLTPRGWIDAGALRVGDVLAAIVPGEDTAGSMTAEEARLLGYLVGDGSCASGQIKLTNETPEVLDDFDRCVAAQGWNSRRRHKRAQTFDCIVKPTEGRWSARADGVSPVVASMTRHGLWGATSYTKRVPAEVMRGSRKAVAAFLGAYWACDGTVAKSVKGSYVVMAYTVSKGLALDLQHLFLKVGIDVHVREKITNTKTARQGDRYTCWAVFVPADQHTKFASLIPMAHHEKTRRIGLAVGGQFERALFEDRVISIEAAGLAQCMCIEVEDDHSFTADDLAVHNSTIVSQAFPAWDWISHPSREFLTASYAGDVAMRDAVDARRVIESPAYQLGFGNVFRLTTDQNVKTRYENDKRGRRTVTSTDAAGTGFGGDIRIVDDPVSAKKADSVLALNASIEW